MVVIKGLLNNNVKKIIERKVTISMNTNKTTSMTFTGLYYTPVLSAYNTCIKYEYVTRFAKIHDFLL